MTKSSLLPSLKLSLLAHVERSGDLTAVGGEWVGQHGGGGGAIEGFSIAPGEAIGPSDIEYQAVLGNDWCTPWVRGGAFCGSRGLALPLLGVRMRIVGDAARKFRLSYWGYFGDCGEVGPLLDGETCGADGAPLEALRVVIEARSSAPSPAPKLVPASRDLISKSRNVIEALKRPAPTATKKPRR